LLTFTVNQKRRFEALSIAARKIYIGRKKRGSHMSWETLSEGGNPFKNPNTADENLQERGLRNKEMPNYHDSIKLERMFEEASHKCYFGPPEMIVCTPPTATKNGWTKGDELYDENYYVAVQRENEQQHRHHHNEKHRKYHHCHHRHRHRQHRHRLKGQPDLNSNDIRTDAFPRKVLNKCPLYQDHPFQPWSKRDNDQLTFVHDKSIGSRNTSYAGSSRRGTELSIPQFVTPKPSSLNINRSGKSLFEKPGYKDKPLDLTLWSPKVGKKGNEVTPVTLELSTKPFPRKREKRRRHIRLASFCSQDQMTPSPYHKLIESESIDYSGRSDFSVSSLSMCLRRSTDSWLSQLMHSKREENHAKTTTVSRRLWFERSDSMKGRAVLNESYVMQMVFFDTITIDETSKEAKF
jgi:hypothetical protein